jgi:hypothetical protein
MGTVTWDLIVGIVALLVLLFGAFSGLGWLLRAHTRLAEWRRTDADQPTGRTDEARLQAGLDGLRHELRFYIGVLAALLCVQLLGTGAVVMRLWAR